MLHVGCKPDIRRKAAARLPRGGHMLCLEWQEHSNPCWWLPAAASKGPGTLRARCRHGPPLTAAQTPADPLQPGVCMCRPLRASGSCPRIHAGMTGALIAAALSLPYFRSLCRVHAASGDVLPAARVPGARAGGCSGRAGRLLPAAAGRGRRRRGRACLCLPGAAARAAAARSPAARPARGGAGARAAGWQGAGEGRRQGLGQRR